MRWDFSTIMVLFVVVSGLIWAFDALVLAPRRRVAATGGNPTATDDVEPPRPSVVVEYAKSFFPVFLVVLLLRSFLIEPFRIPSNSMMPTLLTGDFIVVNKFSYGIRLPITDEKVIEIGEPVRGDVVVFRYPGDPSTPFIKRVVGIPGDNIRYDFKGKVIYVNGKPAEQTEKGKYVGKGSGRGMTGAGIFSERLGDIDHDILVQPDFRRGPGAWGEWDVPSGHYFVMGDNRDNSRDSRSWGFVPDENLIGRAFRIWLNLDWGHGFDWRRIGRAIE
ncbi:MAG: signal peptidase I [Pseudomonadota bacterium]